MDNELLVKSIRDLCKKNNVAVSQLESELNFGAGLVSRWVKSSPSLDKIVDIADYFHVSLDEVVGYNQNIGDEFLNKLYERTSDGSILWEKGEDMNNKGLDVKLYTRYGKDYVKNDTETIYATRFNKGYIIIYAYHYARQILHPDIITLFIQPLNDSSLVKQSYNKDALMKLWIKVLNSLGNNAPDEVKAEDFKNSFINQQKNPLEKIKDNPAALKQIYSQLTSTDPELVDIIAKLNSPEIQRLQQLFSDSGFRALTEQASKIADCFKDINI